VLAVVQHAARAELVQRSDLRVVERGERNLVQVRISHDASSAHYRKDFTTLAGTSSSVWST